MEYNVKSYQLIANNTHLINIASFAETGMLTKKQIVPGILDRMSQVKALLKLFKTIVLFWDPVPVRD